jgi:putative oxidoreductase
MSKNRQAIAMVRIIPALQPVTDALAEPAYALTRFVAGAFLVPHGMWKLFGITGGTREGMIEFFASIGLEPAALLVNAVGLVEFVGGILIALGLLTRPAALAAAITTGTAAIYFHLPRGFYVEPGGVEFAALWAVVLLMIAIRGGGRISLDRLIGREF